MILAFRDVQGRATLCAPDNPQLADYPLLATFPVPEDLVYALACQIARANIEVAFHAVWTQNVAQVGAYSITHLFPPDYRRLFRLVIELAGTIPARQQSKP